jgi:hypothetical protein
MLRQKGLSLRRRKLIWLMAFFKCHKCQTVAPPSPKKFATFLGTPFNRLFLISNSGLGYRQTGGQTVFLIKEV